MENEINESDPKVGSGKKPKGSDRRLYTDENPADTVSVKFRTKQDVIDTLNKASFKSKSHQRQSQIINLIHQRLRVAVERAKDPEVKSRLKLAFEYAEIQKEKSKKKTIKMNENNTTEKNWTGNNIMSFSSFINESVSIVHLKGMTDMLAKADSDLGLIKDDNAKKIKEVLNQMIGDLAQMEVIGEVPTKEFMQNLVLSLQGLKEQGKAIPFSKYPDFSQMGGKFSAPLASLQRAIDKAKYIIDFAG